MACNDRNSTDAKCIKYTGGDLACSGIVKNDALDVIISKLDSAICEITGGTGLTSIGISSSDLSVSNSPLTANGSISLSISNGAVTFAKMQNLNSARIMGRYSATSGIPQEISIGTGLTLSVGGVLSANTSGTVTSIGLTSSDITVGGSSPITSSGTYTLTLPTINSNVGTFNNLTVNGKGQVTAGSNIAYITGNQSITLSGDVTGTGTTSIVTTITPSAVLYSKIQDTTASRIIGNPTGIAAAPSEISLSTGLAFSGTSIIVSPNTTNQQVEVQLSGSSIGTRKTINFINGANTTITPVDDGSNDRINITIDSAGGGGGGTPGGSSGQLQYNNASAFGGTIAGVYSTSGNLFTYTAQVATDIPTTVKGAVSQSANLQNWVNSSNTVLASVSSSGVITGANLSGTNTGDQTITLTGDVTGSGTGSFAATIPNDTVTYAKIQNVTQARILGRYTASTGDIEEISVGAGLTLNSSGILSSTATGTVTSIAVSGNNGIGVSGSPVTVSGTITLSLGAITPTTVNGLTLTALATGFTVAGGTSSRTLTVPANASVSNTNTGDVTVSGQNYITLSSQVLTIGQVNLSGTHVTGTLAAARMPALTGDITSTVGTVATTISNSAVTYAKIQNVTTQKLLGRYSGTTGVVQEITLGSGLSLDTSTGTLTASGSGGGSCFDTLSVFTNSPNTTITGTNYISLNGDSFSTTLADRVIIIPSSGFIKNLFIIASGTQGASTLTFTLMKSSSTIAAMANTALVLTVASGTAAGTGTVYSNTADSVSVNAGDILVLKAASSSASFKILGISMLFTNQ